MKALLSSTLVLIFAAAFANPAFADNRPSFKTDQTNYLLQTSPGKTLNENIVVRNSTDSKQSLLISFEGYKLPANQVLDQSYLTKHNIDFATLPLQQIDIEALANTVVPIVLTPPETYPSGDYYGTLILNKNGEIRKVNFTVRILGKLQDSVDIKEISNSGDFLVYKVVNTGTIASDFSVESKLNWFLGSDKTFHSNKETIRSGEILEIRLNHGKLLPGFYQNQNTLKYGSKETESSKLFSFWVNSEFFVIGLVTLLMSFFFYFVFIRRSV